MPSDRPQRLLPEIFQSGLSRWHRMGRVLSQATIRWAKSLAPEALFDPIQGQCYVWRLNDESSGFPRFQAVTRFLAHSKYLTRCLLSPDARYLATCSADTTVKIWSISPGFDFKQEKILIGHQRWVWDCAFSADSAYLVTGERMIERVLAFD